MSPSDLTIRCATLPAEYFPVSMTKAGCSRTDNLDPSFQVLFPFNPRCDLTPLVCIRGAFSYLDFPNALVEDIVYIILLL